MVRTSPPWWILFFVTAYGILQGWSVGDCGKTGRENGAMGCPNIGVRRGTYNTIKMEKGEISWAVRRYADVTREDVQTPLG